MDERHRTLRNSLLISVLVTLAMMGSVIIYMLVAAFFVGQGQTVAVPGGPGLHAALLAAALLCAVGGPAYFRMQRRGLTGDPRGTPAGLALVRLLRARIVGLALAETAAVLGLVQTLTTGDIRWSAALSLLALAAMAFLWPRRRQLERITFPDEVQAIEPR
ncbi:MAG: hypothetical protein GXP47_04340 [Acidobacteria bacterium]|nr:hypothetical protein [Acidobacteriota bacterium]